MDAEIITYDENVPTIADDSLLRVAQQAEQRIEAVIKIKQMALKVTNHSDWVDQNGKPYLMVSGSEKIANLFSISWRIEEPRFEQEPDGHYTYTYMGTFSIPGRSVQVDGSRSSKDPFFNKYDWVEGKKVEKPIAAIDRRDVKMAAMTNLLGNGITRLLGIRNLSYDDLAKFAGITQEMVTTIKYKKRGEDKPPLQEPKKRLTDTDEAPLGDPSSALLHVTQNIAAVTIRPGTSKKTGNPYEKYIITDGNKAEYTTFSKTVAETAKRAMEAGIRAELGYTVNKYGNALETIGLLDIPPDRPAETRTVLMPVCPEDEKIPASVFLCSNCDMNETCPVAKEVLREI